MKKHINGKNALILGLGVVAGLFIGRTSAVKRQLDRVMPTRPVVTATVPTERAEQS